MTRLGLARRAPILPRIIKPDLRNPDRAQASLVGGEVHAGLFRRWRPGDAARQRSDRATMAYMDFFRGIAREPRDHPANDVATLIATAEVDGGLIGEFEASSYFVALASAGHDITSFHRNVPRQDRDGSLLPRITGTCRLDRPFRRTSLDRDLIFWEARSDYRSASGRPASRRCARHRRQQSKSGLEARNRAAAVHFPIGPSLVSKCGPGNNCNC
jgi:hypothetical protein